jgi:hypothetical protein
VPSTPQAILTIGHVFVWSTVDDRLKCLQRMWSNTLDGCTVHPTAPQPQPWSTMPRHPVGRTARRWARANLGPYNAPLLSAPPAIDASTVEPMGSPALQPEDLRRLIEVVLRLVEIVEGLEESIQRLQSSETLSRLAPLVQGLGQDIRRLSAESAMHSSFLGALVLRG